MNRRRTITRVVVFLLAGAVVNVAVAWGCATWSRASRVENQWFLGLGYSARFEVHTQHGPDGKLLMRSTSVLERHVGWPLRSISQYPWTSLDRWLSRRFFGLPVRPRWPGFAINTVFYAAILWVLFAAPGRFRRWQRIKRGLCPKCAYPVGASELCTECGKRVKGALT